MTGGYLQGPDPGLIGPGRAVGPRGVGIDSSGDIYTAEGCLPGVVEDAWYYNGPCAIVTKYKPDGSPRSVWRDYNTNTWGRRGTSADETTFFGARFEYKRDANGNYQPYAFTADPFDYPADPRSVSAGNSGNGLGWPTFTWDADGHRYIGTDSDNAPPSPYTIFEQQPHSEIFKQVAIFNQSAQDNFMDSSQNLWQILNNRVIEYKVTGYAADGDAGTDSGTNLGRPAGCSDMRRIDVEGNSVYLGCFSAKDQTAAAT